MSFAGIQCASKHPTEPFPRVPFGRHQQGSQRSSSARSPSPRGKASCRTSSPRTDGESVTGGWRHEPGRGQSTRQSEPGRNEQEQSALVPGLCPTREAQSGEVFHERWAKKAQEANAGGRGRRKAGQLSSCD